MRQNFGPKPFLYPMPVLIIATYGPDGTANAMNAAWGCAADMDRVAIYVAGEHRTMANILERRAFTVSMATADYVKEADYVGVVSGNTVPDKLARTGWHVGASSFVDAPVIDELPMTLEILTDGRIDPEKLAPITYDPVNHTYRTLGPVVGRAFSDGKALK